MAYYLINQLADEIIFCRFDFHFKFSELPRRFVCNFHGHWRLFHSTEVRNNPNAVIFRLIAHLNPPRNATDPYSTSDRFNRLLSGDNNALMRHQVFLCREVVLDGELKLIVMKRVLAGKKMQKSCTCWCRKMLRKVWVSSCETSVSHAKALLCGSFATLIIIYCHLASNYFFFGVTSYNVDKRRPFGF